MIPDLRIGGLARLSLCDWPGELVATVFLRGCPWRCPYCHNPGLLGARDPSDPAWEDVFGFLQSRRGLLDGVVFSGGEPTTQGGLGAAIEAARGLGFRVGLHTGGAFPDRLEALLPRLDWVGFDVKAPFDAYAAITGVADSGARARASLDLLLASGVEYEVRTTLHPALIDDAALDALATELAALGVASYVLQPFRAEGCADADLARSARGLAMPTLSAQAQAAFPRFCVRAG